jgi:hypothetical protein
MFRKFMVLCGLMMLVLFSGCASNAQFAGLSYHHSNPADGSYWMTIVGDKTDSALAASLWRCENKPEGPRCVQAKLLSCTNQSECEIVARVIAQQDFSQHVTVPAAPR